MRSGSTPFATVSNGRGTPLQRPRYPSPTAEVPHCPLPTADCAARELSTAALRHMLAPSTQGGNRGSE
eukprot:3297640-Rhodomonas_salina.1